MHAELLLGPQAPLTSAPGKSLTHYQTYHPRTGNGHVAHTQPKPQQLPPQTLTVSPVWCPHAPHEMQPLCTSSMQPCHGKGKAFHAVRWHSACIPCTKLLICSAGAHIHLHDATHGGSPSGPPTQASVVGGVHLGSYTLGPCSYGSLESLLLRQPPLTEPMMVEVKSYRHACSHPCHPKPTDCKMPCTMSYLSPANVLELPDRCNFRIQ